MTRVGLQSHRKNIYIYIYIYTGNTFYSFCNGFRSFGEYLNKYIIRGHDHLHFCVTSSSHIILHLILHLILKFFCIWIYLMMANIGRNMQYTTTIIMIIINNPIQKCSSCPSFINFRFHMSFRLILNFEVLRTTMLLCWKNQQGQAQICFRNKNEEI